MRWGGLTGALIATYTVIDAYAVRHLGLAPVALARPARFAAAMRGHWRLAIGVGLLSPLSCILVLFALDMGAPVSVVAPMREMSMMLGALLGMVVLRERVGVWRLIGCAVLIAGVVLLGTA